MNCGECGGPTRVIDSRPYLDGDVIYRRRECGDCGERVTTFEVKEGGRKKNPMIKS